MNSVRNIQITYDTLKDMKADPDLKPGMVVSTLGKNKINDSYGEIYKIVCNEGSSESFSTEHITFDNNNYVHAEPIGSSNYEDRIVKMQNAIGTNAVNISQNREDIDKIKQNIVNVQECFSADSIYEAYSTTGVRIVLLGNGQKAVVVTDIPLSEDDYIDEESNQGKDVQAVNEDKSDDTSATSDETEATTVASDEDSDGSTIINYPVEISIDPVTYELSGTTATITVPIELYRWVEPATLRLIGYANTKLYVNDNCILSYEDNKITFTVNRQLNPAVYYYM